MGKKDKNNAESNKNLSKQTLADDFFERFVENEDQIEFTNEDIFKEIKNLEKNLKKYDVLEIVLDCCSEEIISEYITITFTYEDFIDCFIFTDNLGSRLSQFLKGELLNIYNSAKKYWHLIAEADVETERDAYIRIFKEDTFKRQICEHGGYRNYLKNVKPTEKCASCGKDLREHEGYYSRGDNVYCFFCKKDLIWCKSCATHVRPSDFIYDVYCKYCYQDSTGDFDDSITMQLEPDFESFEDSYIKAELDPEEEYKEELYSDAELAEIYENLVSEENFSKPVEILLEDFLSNEIFYHYLCDEPSEAEIEKGVLKTTPISHIHPGKVYLISGVINKDISLFIHSICVQCGRTVEDCLCQDNGNKKEMLIVHIEIGDDTDSIDCLFLDSVAEKLVRKKVAQFKQIVNKPDFMRFLDKLKSELLGEIMYIRGKVEYWENSKKLLLITHAFKYVNVNEELDYYYHQFKK